MYTQKINNILKITAIITIAMAFSTFAGTLEPTSPPSSGTMKTLDQVEPRIPIQSVPSGASIVHYITQPGSYYLTDNIVSDEKYRHVIYVAASGVTIDLNGFSISRSWVQTAASNPVAYYDAIYIKDGFSNITIKNGSIISDYRTDGDNAYRGFRFGIYAYGNGTTSLASDCVTVSNVSVTMTDNTGISLLGKGNLVEKCTVYKCDGPGITAYDNSIIKNCIVYQNDSYGITAESGCIITGNATSNNTYYGIKAENNCIIKENIIKDNSSTGIYCSDSCDIQNNSCSGNINNGIRCHDGCTVKDNVCTGNTGYGIYCHNGCTVKENSCSANTGSGGIYCYRGCTVMENTCYANNGYGIYCREYCQIKANTCTDNTGTEIYIFTGGIIADNYTFN
ncbi:MAG: right-handed parallel beta-helix repeat-containing protein [Phycisphaerae bacterium]|nr:right-handed parallel beta-helix repeat-containing protein [Phycisphaerae bacterium]